MNIRPAWSFSLQEAIMKTAILFATIIGSLAFAATSQAGPRVSVYVGSGGYCGPRYYAPPVCYVPRRTYYRPAPVYYAPAPVVYVPAPRFYRAPVRRASFGWCR
ncbi:MAG TPA: hypothetical protein VIM61_10300 [Chthoniobacterales bacterium]